MLDFKTIREQLSDCSLCKVAKASGVTYPTLQKIMQGKENFNTVTIKKISDYIYSKQLKATNGVNDEEAN
jgi:predicted transcriptional regulator